MKTSRTVDLMQAVAALPRTAKTRAPRPKQVAMFRDELTAEPLIIDYFAGGGGASTGIERALGRSPDVAINHDEHAVHIHSLNHPKTDHLRVDVWDVDPRRHIPAGDVALAWFSPDCRHFSRSKGGKPVEKKIRGLAWVICRVAGTRRPNVIVMENVGEFLTWGPCRKMRFGKRKGQVLPIKSKAGQTFAKFVRQLEGIGYRVEHRILNAADYGAPTRRLRLVLIARRDGAPVVWPEPTHGPGRAHPYRTAAECIDWSVPTVSIFDRAKPLADATQRRIAEGMRRFVFGTGAPFIVQIGNGERKGQSPRVMSAEKPLGTVVAGAVKHGLVTAFVAKHFGGPNGHQTPGQSLDAPLGTVTAKDHHGLVTCELAPAEVTDRSRRVAAFLTKWYSSGPGAQGLDEPLHTIVSKDRFGLVTVTIEGESYAVVDIGLRMLTPRELARAQGFSDDFVLVGSQADQVARIGNSVSPPMAQAVVAANVASKPRKVAPRAA